MNNHAEILIVDDEEDICKLISGILEDEGYSTRMAHTASHAVKEISEKVPDMVILDIWLNNSDKDGLQILSALKKDYPAMPVVMISGHGTIETAVNAIKDGAYDFIEKPFKSDRLLLLIRRALEAAALKRENQFLKAKHIGQQTLLGNSRSILSVKNLVAKVAPTNSRILITGEAGTGKDLVARMIHKQSKRSDGAFVAINCAIMNPERLESELFGEEDHHSGILKKGVLEQAHMGTLFLDEVADMPPETQSKIVRVLQEQSFKRVGGTKSIEVDIRLIASTNRDLKQIVDEGNFRQDLYYRLNVVPIHMPPLREMPEDIGILTEHFAQEYSKTNGIPACRFSKSAIDAMKLYEWNGNVRQLKNTVEWCMIMYSGNRKEITTEHLPPDISGDEDDNSSKAYSHSLGYYSVPLKDAREQFEKDYLLQQINKFKGNISRTAKFIGMERSALHRKLKSLGIFATSEKEELSSVTEGKAKNA